MTETTIATREFSDIENDFIKISGPILAATDLLAEATSRNDFDIAGLRDGTICNLSDLCHNGIRELSSLFYEVHDLHKLAISMLKAIIEEEEPELSELDKKLAVLERTNEFRKALKSEIKELKKQEARS
ncbi:MAG: hypothetical protein ABW077_04035 [Candidatus Thiodiazotropha endolucinida]